MNNNRKSKMAITYALVTVAIGVALMSSSITPSFAPKPHEVQSNPLECIANPPPGEVKSRTLTCDGKIAGLGNVGPTVQAFITATVTVSCTTPSGSNEPPGQQRIQSQPTTFQVTNGAINFDGSLTASLNKCSGNKVSFIGQFTNVAIVINGFTVQVPGSF